MKAPMFQKLKLESSPPQLRRIAREFNASGVCFVRPQIRSAPSFIQSSLQRRKFGGLQPKPKTSKKLQKLNGVVHEYNCHRLATSYRVRAYRPVRCKRA